MNMVLGECESYHVMPSNSTEARIPAGTLSTRIDNHRMTKNLFISLLLKMHRKLSVRDNNQTSSLHYCTGFGVFIQISLADNWTRILFLALMLSLPTTPLLLCFGGLALLRKRWS
jgi:hypothetical protein